MVLGELAVAGAKLSVGRSHKTNFQNINRSLIDRRVERGANMTNEQHPTYTWLFVEILVAELKELPK